MIWLALGVLLWSGVHLFPSLGASTRAAWIERAGEGPYKGGFALALVLAIVLMVLGWRSTTPEWIYTPPAWGRWATNVAMLVAFVLFAASGVPTNLKRVLRHPQLTGFAIWALGHLLSNGEQRALVLFGGLGLWSVVSKRRLPILWAAEFTRQVTWKRITVETKNPQTSICQPFVPRSGRTFSRKAPKANMPAATSAGTSVS